MSEPNFNYVILDTRHPGYADTIKAYEIEHRKAWPQNNLSIVPNVDGTQVLVKVDAGKERPTWTAKAYVTDKSDSLVLQTFTFKDHDKVIALLQTPEWKPKEETNK